MAMMSSDDHSSKLLSSRLKKLPTDTASLRWVSLLFRCCYMLTCLKSKFLWAKIKINQDSILLHLKSPKYLSRCCVIITNKLKFQVLDVIFTHMLVRYESSTNCKGLICYACLFVYERMHLQKINTTFLSI